MTELSTHVFELNLTSVCVSSGEIQLPLKMLEFFAAGTVAAELDGESVELGFQAPRRLYGLRDHFGARGLRSNDKVRFVLEVEQGRVVGLTATCVKRERQRPAEGEAEQGRPERRGEAPRSHAMTRWESVEEVRAVKRVRIPGLPAAQAPSELAAVTQSSTSVGQVEGRSAASSWEPDPVARREPTFEDGLTTVRVRRRQRDVAAEAVPAPEPAAAAAHVSAVEPQVVGPHSETDMQLQLSDLIAPPMASQRSQEKSADPAWRPRNWAALTSRMRLGSRPSAAQPRERPYTSGPRSDAAPRAAAAQRDEDVVEERELVAASVRPSLPNDGTLGPARPISRAVSTEVPAEDEPRGGAGVAGMASPGLGAAHGGATVDRLGGVDGYGVKLRAEAPDRVPAPMPVSRNGPGATAPAVARMGGSRVNGRPAPATPDMTAATDMTTGAAAEARHRPAEPRNVPLIDDADFGGEYLVHQTAEPVATAGAGGLEADIALVDEFLRRPDTPAIVRAEAVGEVLAIGEERAERALERISERPDHVNRIRRGAYMVRGRRG